MGRTILLVGAVLLHASAAAAEEAPTRPSEGVLEWSALPPLPPAPEQDVQPGVAGPFVGVLDRGGELFVAVGEVRPAGHEQLPPAVQDADERPRHGRP
ncbi:MAG: hypothetical protein R6X20_18540, partial [Phycisphaerae bacterium]